MPIRRTIKNVVKNYTPAEVKVREATCNDQWGPNTTLMNEIADLTHSSLARNEIMNMIWKRLSDTGKNWRHVIKSLSLLEYLAKVGSPQVAEMCKSHIHLISLLNDFQYYENGVDYGAAIREKSKNFANLLKDNERFKNERQKAIATKDRLAHSTGLGMSGGKISNSVSDRYLSSSDRFGGSQRQIAVTTLSPELEAVRPSSFGEEDLQLQLALAMSKEQHSEEVKKRKGDDLKLKMAIEESKKASHEEDQSSQLQSTTESFAKTLSLSPASDPFPFLPPPNQSSTSAQQAPPTQSTTWSEFKAPSDPFNLSGASWNSPVQPDPFFPVANTFDQSDPFVPQASNQPQASKDPWAPLDAFAQPNGGNSLQSTSQAINNSNLSPQQKQQLQQQPLIPHQPPLQPQQPPIDLDNEFDMLGRRGSKQQSIDNDNILGALTDDFLIGNVKETKVEDKPKRDLVSDFLGENAKLVDLNQLITKPPPSTLTNPFSMTPYSPETSSQPNYNLFNPSSSSAFSQQSAAYNQNSMVFNQPSTNFNQPSSAFNQPFSQAQNFNQAQFTQPQNFPSTSQSFALSNGVSNANPFL